VIQADKGDKHYILDTWNVTIISRMFWSVAFSMSFATARLHYLQTQTAF